MKVSELEKGKEYYYVSSGPLDLLKTPIIYKVICDEDKGPDKVLKSMVGEYIVHIMYVGCEADIEDTLFETIEEVESFFKKYKTEIPKKLINFLKQN